MFWLLIFVWPKRACSFSGRPHCLAGKLGKKEKTNGLVLTHTKALTWLIFAIYQPIVKFYAESEYDVYFFQKLWDNVEIEHFMIPPLFDKKQRVFSTCVILILFLFFFNCFYNLNFVTVIKPQLFFFYFISRKRKIT